MDVSPNALRKETVLVFRQVQQQIDEVVEEHGEEEIEDPEAKKLFISLLQTKALCLATLTQLTEMARRK